MKQIMFVTEEDYKNFELRCKNTKNNQPDMREKVREYITELEAEIERVEQCIIDNGEDAVDTNNMLFSRIQTIIEVKNDLQGRLDEVI